MKETEPVSIRLYLRNNFDKCIDLIENIKTYTFTTIDFIKLFQKQLPDIYSSFLEHYDNDYKKVNIQFGKFLSQHNENLKITKIGKTRAKSNNGQNSTCEFWEKLNKWNVDGEKFVAFFDIKGFKDYINRNEINKIKDELISFTKKINSYFEVKKIHNNERIKKIQFSDSIFLFTSGNSKEDFDIICEACYVIMRHAFELKIPLMGAISKGIMVTNFENNIFFGQPIIDAFSLSEELLYYGVVLDCNLDKYIIENTEFHNIYLYRGLTPFKNGDSIHYNIATATYGIEKIEGLSTTLFNFYTTVSGSKRKFVDNTFGMIRAMTKEVLNYKGNPSIKND